MMAVTVWLSPPMRDALIFLIFILTYIGMAAGRLPALQVERTGIALIGVILLLLTGSVTLDELGGSQDNATLVLLFALMIISAQFASAGLYDLAADWIMSKTRSPVALLALTVAICGALSAFLANDVVVFAMAPLLLAGAQARGLDPRPFLIALAGASNAGAAATLIGSPQNILLGQVGDLSFYLFLLICLVPAMVGLLAVFVVIWFIWHDRITSTVLAVTGEVPAVPRHAYDRFQAIKGLAAMGCLLLLFITPLPRETVGLTIAALLLANRKFTSRTMIAAVDWPLLLLFVCLFAITGALSETGLPWRFLSTLQDHGLLPDNIAVLAPLSLVMSNTFGAVPSVILLLKVWPNPPQGTLYGIALLSSLAGNLLVVGSLANLIVVERAAAYGVRLSFSDFARAGIPITIISMAFAIFWLSWTGWLPWVGVSASN